MENKQNLSIEIQSLESQLSAINEKNILLINAQKQAAAKKKKTELESIQKELEENIRKSQDIYQKIKELQKKQKFDVWALPNPEDEAKDKHVKFKNIMARLRLESDPTLYVDKTKQGWYGLKRIAGTAYTYVTTLDAQKLYERVQSQALSSLNSASYVIEKTQDAKNGFINKVLFLGEKLWARKLEKKFSKQLQTLGFNTQEILHGHKKESYFSTPELDQTILEDLKSKYTITYNQGLDFEILNNTTDDIKKEIIQNVLWPQLKTSLSDSLEMVNVINNVKKTNPSLYLLNSFCEKNKLSSDTVIHLLKNSPELLTDKDSSGAKKLYKSKDEILESNQKYQELLNNANKKIFLYIESIDKIQNIYQSLNISNEEKSQYNTQMQEIIQTTIDRKALNFNEIKINAIEMIKKAKETLTDKELGLINSLEFPTKKMK